MTAFFHSFCFLLWKPNFRSHRQISQTGMGSAFAMSALCIFKIVCIVQLIKEVIRAIYLFFCSWRIPSSTILFWVYSICLRWSWRKFVFDAVVISLTRVSLDWYGWFERRYTICLKRKTETTKDTVIMGERLFFIHFSICLIRYRWPFIYHIFTM